VTFPLFGNRRLGIDLSATAAVFAGIGLLLAVVQASLVHPAVRRFGEVGTLRLGLLVNAVGLLLLGAVHSWLLLVPALAALVVGQGLAMPSLTSAFAGRAGPHRRGGVLGVQQSASGLARVIGPLAGGLVFDRIGIAAPYLLGAVMMAVCALLIVPKSSA
jgi:predicted MFS family arabinose efflux permease